MSARIRLKKFESSILRTLLNESIFVGRFKGISKFQYSLKICSQENEIEISKIFIHNCVTFTYEN